MLTAIALAVTILISPPVYLDGTPAHEFQFEYFKYGDSGEYQISGTFGNSKIAGTCSWSIMGIRCDLYYRGKYDGGDRFVPGLMIINADFNFTGTALLCFMLTGECPVTLEVRQK